MAISKIIHVACQTCGKVFVEKSRIDFGDKLMLTGECGHMLFTDKVTTAFGYDFTSTDGKQLRGYQIEGIKFAEQANFRCLIADEQGLGKTMQALGILRLHAEIGPWLILTKTTLTHQWYKEIERWCAERKLIVQVLKSGLEKAIPGFDVYITTMDLVKTEGMFDLLPEPVPAVIIDECQGIKNHLSQRAKAVQEICKTATYVVALSGTPIKNHAGEYFTILNILQPTRFPTFQGFLNTYCDSYSTMYGPKVGGLANPELFKSATDDFIIRRTRAEAAPEIPIVDRQFFHVELDKRFNKAYAAALDELEELFYKDEDENTGTSMIAIMTKLRKITGISKVPAAVDYAIEFLVNEPERKLVIFAHHHDVVNALEMKLNAFLAESNLHTCLNLNATLSADKRAELVDRFKNNPHARIMIASTLAAGEGLNLQFCSRAVMLERQWNPANEEQAEGRFARIGQEDNIIVTYMLASETIDEKFTEIVETKRAIIANTLDGKEYQWDQASLMKELATVLVMKGKKKWTL
jgi:SNF2 family DNA or RNA helicase